MIIYTNGCSHTAGHCMKRDKAWPRIIMKSIIGSEPFSSNVAPTTIKKDSHVLYNQAMHGAGNDYIFHTSLETISTLIESGNKPDYVFIQWSGPNRRMHSNESGDYVFVNPWDNFDLGIKFEPMASQHTLHYMFALQEMLKKNDIPYWFFNYMELSKSIKKSNVYSQLDLTRMLDFDSDITMFTGLIDFFKSNNMNCDEGGHPNEIGNYFIGEYITKKIGYECIDYSVFYNTTYI